jgi:integrase
MKRERHQVGRVYEASGKFYVQYRRTEIIDGTPKRVQRSELLCEKDAAHKSVTSKAVLLKRDEFMLRVNAPTVKRGAMSVVDYWTGVYVPFAEKNLRASSLGGYKQIWNQHLKNHFGEMLLTEYSTGKATAFLTKLAEKYSRRTLQHIRTTASALFQHATRLEYIPANPWRGAAPLGTIRDTDGTAHYTLEEAEAIVNALIERTDAQLLFALCFWLGLRPSEAIALQWGDFGETNVHIRRGVVRGVVGPPKTPESVASLPVIEPVTSLLKAWRSQCLTSKDGWLFPTTSPKGETVMDLRNFSANVIRPIVQDKVGATAWKGLYAGRRGAGTTLVELTGNLVAAQELLRHKSLTTTAMFYKKRTQTALSSGMKLLESKSAATGK